MFDRTSSLPFGTDAAPPELISAFEALRAVVAPPDADELAQLAITELGRSALHGVASLERAKRLRPDLRRDRVGRLVRWLDQIAAG